MRWSKFYLTNSDTGSLTLYFKILPLFCNNYLIQFSKEYRQQSKVEIGCMVPTSFIPLRFPCLTYKRHSCCSINFSMELFGDKSWDARMFQAAVVAVVFAVLLNCLLLLSFQKAPDELLSHRCKSVGHCRCLSCQHLRLRCLLEMVVTNLEENKNWDNFLPWRNSIDVQSKCFVSILLIYR